MLTRIIIIDQIITVGVFFLIYSFHGFCRPIIELRMPRRDHFNLFFLENRLFRDFHMV